MEKIPPDCWLQPWVLALSQRVKPTVMAGHIQLLVAHLKDHPILFRFLYDMPPLFNT